jgi:hypothetical protein
VDALYGMQMTCHYFWEGNGQMDQSPWWVDPRRVAAYPAYLNLDDISKGMSVIDTPQPGEDWLQPYIEAALVSGMCVRMHCWKCSPTPFKAGVVLLASGRVFEGRSRHVVTDRYRARSA